MEVAEDIRHTIGNRQIYQLRKETIERIFGTAKEQHGFRYTQYVGKARMEMKAGLTFACMNLKKLAKILEKRGWNTVRFLLILKKIKKKRSFKEKRGGGKTPHPNCLSAVGGGIYLFPISFPHNKELNFKEISESIRNKKNCPQIQCRCHQRTDGRTASCRTGSSIRKTPRPAVITRVLSEEMVNKIRMECLPDAGNAGKSGTCRTDHHNLRS